jgi:hypothetical protein
VESVRRSINAGIAVTVAADPRADRERVRDLPRRGPAVGVLVGALESIDDDGYGVHEYRVERVDRVLYLVDGCGSTVSNAHRLPQSGDLGDQLIFQFPAIAVVSARALVEQHFDARERLANRPAQCIGRVRGQHDRRAQIADQARDEPGVDVSPIESAEQFRQSSGFVALVDASLVTLLAEIEQPEEERERMA